MVILPGGQNKVAVIARRPYFIEVAVRRGFIPVSGQFQLRTPFSRPKGVRSREIPQYLIGYKFKYRTKELTKGFKSFASLSLLLWLFQHCLY